MKLYTFVGSPNGRKVQAVISHLHLDVEIEYRDVFEGDLRTPDYLALNPNAKVPTLVDGPFVLWESAAIMQYLADKAGSDGLFPRDPRKRADVVRWQCWEGAHFNRAFGTLTIETIIKPRHGFGATNEALVETAKADLTRYAPVLEGHLADRRHLVGDGITIADYSMIALEPYQASVAFDWTPYPSLNAYFERMRKTTAWAQSAPASVAEVGRRPKAA
jgi:glutathione S-transferase